MRLTKMAVVATVTLSLGMISMTTPVFAATAPGAVGEGDLSGGISAPGTVPMQSQAAADQARAKQDLALRLYAAYRGGDPVTA